MQSKDDQDKIKQLVKVNLDKPNDLVSKIKSAEEKGATSHTIGKLVIKDERVVIHGLSYRVEFADFVKGKFTVKLICRDL